MSPASLNGKMAVKCCKKEGIPDECLGFCFLMTQKGLNLRLGPCEEYKAEIESCGNGRSYL